MNLQNLLRTALWSRVVFLVMAISPWKQQGNKDSNDITSVCFAVFCCSQGSYIMSWNKFQNFSRTFQGSFSQFSRTKIHKSTAIFIETEFSLPNLTIFNDIYLLKTFSVFILLERCSQVRTFQDLHQNSRTFQAWKMIFWISMTFQDFPGAVRTLYLSQMELPYVKLITGSAENTAVSRKQFGYMYVKFW